MTNTTRIYRRTLKIPTSAIDENGHANNVAFVQWMHAEGELRWSTTYLLADRKHKG